VPGWHAKTKDLVAEGKLKVLGIVEEQHPERAVLFMQWQQMGWPVLSDPLNLLGVYAIPYTFLIDEHGIIRYKNPKPEDLDTFLATAYEKPQGIDRPEIAIASDSAEHALMWGGDEGLDGAIRQLGTRATAAPDDAITQFRLGVAYRMRHDSPVAEEEDFSRAVAAWQRALKLNPAQYIWRRRIQQYGPRLDKPYSFYDWVNEARGAITDRGEIPHPLAAEPSGSEFAHPGPDGASAGFKPGDHPDPDRKLPLDRSQLVHSEVIAVRSTDPKKPAFRVHLRFRPDRSQKVHWSNDAGPLRFFPDADTGVSIHDFQAPGGPPEALTSNEERSLEFEIRPAEGQNSLPANLKGAAFYFVCEDVNGRCQFLRQDIEIELK